MYEKSGRAADPYRAACKRFAVRDNRQHRRAFIPRSNAGTAPWTEEDVLAIARTLSGECYEDKTQDKRLVAEVIVNRVSAGHFGDTVIDVVTSPYQFVGYWNPSREISESDMQIATETLRDWYANDCNALSEWLYFTAGDNRENNFRTEYEEE